MTVEVVFKEEEFDSGVQDVLQVGGREVRNRIRLGKREEKRFEVKGRVGGRRFVFSMGYGQRGRRVRFFLLGSSFGVRVLEDATLFQVEI